jgi:uncharacterized protein with NAD-binding domain and iron-sulfur cluster
MTVKKRVLILGGGLAGLAAGLEILDRAGERYAVTLACMEGRLGGKAASWRLPDGRYMETGFHSLFGYYTAVPALLSRCGREVTDERWFTTNGGVHRIYDAGANAVNTLRVPSGPLDVRALLDSDLLGYRGMNPSQKLRTGVFLARLAAEFARGEPPPSMDEDGFTPWCVAHGLDLDLTRSPWFRYIFDLTYNYPHEGSAYVGVKGFRDMFGFRKSPVVYFNGPMSEVLIAPIAEAFVRAGGSIEFCAKATGVALDRAGRAVTEVTLAPMGRAVRIDGVYDRVGVDVGDGVDALAEAPYPKGDPAPQPGAAVRVLRAGQDFDAVISALPIDSLRALLRTTSDFPRDVLDHAELRGVWKLRTVASISLRMWLDAQVFPSDYDTVVLGTPQPAATVIDYANRVASLRGGKGSVVEMLGQEGLDGDLADDELVRRMLRNLAGLPFVDGARFDPERVLAQAGGNRWLFRRNTAHHMRYVLAEPGHWKHRLDARVRGYDNLFFAGDWVRSSQPTPSTEAAVRAGVAAAGALLASL